MDGAGVCCCCCCCWRQIVVDALGCSWTGFHACRQGTASLGKYQHHPWSAVHLHLGPGTMSETARPGLYLAAPPTVRADDGMMKLQAAVILGPGAVCCRRDSGYAAAVTSHDKPQVPEASQMHQAIAISPAPRIYRSRMGLPGTTPRIHTCECMSGVSGAACWIQPPLSTSGRPRTRCLHQYHIARSLQPRAGPCLGHSIVMRYPNPRKKRNSHQGFGPAPRRASAVNTHETGSQCRYNVRYGRVHDRLAALLSTSCCVDRSICLDVAFSGCKPTSCDGNSWVQI